MNDLLLKIRGKKTYILSGLAILTAWVMCLVGDLTVGQALTATFGAGGLGTLRSAMNNKSAGVRCHPVALLMAILFVAVVAMMFLTGCETVKGGQASLSFTDDGTIAAGYQRGGSRAEVLRTAGGGTSFAFYHVFGAGSSGKKVVAAK